MRWKAPNKQSIVVLKQNHQKISKMKDSRLWNMETSISTLMAITAVIILTVAQLSECYMDHHGPISQISPKSSSLVMEELESLRETSRLPLEATIAEASSNQKDESLNNDDDEGDHLHVRMERSALPILNEKNYPNTGLNEVRFPAEEEKDAIAGRYYHYNIKPTTTLDSKPEEDTSKQKGRSGKTLDLKDKLSTTASSFLLKGDLRQDMSGSPISPTSTTAISTMASATVAPHNPRQNSNPDIQDIITGIVKLLNGNVNVHANTQGLRRPSASRINNRGPPRISDVPALPIDYDVHNHGTSIRPPPYPFDRPDRPFITGVPLPEQIVPYRPGFVSNRPPWHRNKPRPPINTAIGGRRPVPQSQYKPLPATQMKPPEEFNDQDGNQQQTDFSQQQSESGSLESQKENHQQEHSQEKEEIQIVNHSEDEAKPTDTTFDSEFSNEDSNTQYIEVSDDTENIPVESDLEDLEIQSPVVPVISSKKEEKKKPGKPKGNDKKKHDYTTIVQTSSVIHTVVGMSSTYMPMPMPSHEDVGIDPSTEEVIFMTPSKTPTLLRPSSTISSFNVQPSEEAVHFELPPSIRPLEMIEPTPSSSYVEPSKLITSSTSTISNSHRIKTENTETNPLPQKTTPQPPLPNPPIQSQDSVQTSPQPSPYQPRPGIVLDDPEFKPGGRPRPQRPSSPSYPSPPQQQHPQNIQPTRSHLPPGYGEIFDVTLSAIQGPGNGAGSKQTINIKPYGSYGGIGTGLGSGGNPDIIISAQGDDGFVSIDGKRTYINLFGDPTDPPTGVQAATTPATALPQIPGNAQNGNGNGGSGSGGGSNEAPSTPNLPAKVPASGYGIAETEIVELDNPKTIPKSPPGQNPQGSTTNTAPTRPHYRPRTTQPPVRIDTCIVGDDSTCDQAQHERCKTENGVSSCHCRPGYSRRKHREPCRKVINFYIGMRVDRIYEHRIVWDTKLLDRSSEPYGQLSYEAIRAIDSAMSMTPYSDEFMQAKVNNIYRGDPNLGGSGVFVNLTIKLDESVETLRPNLRSDVQKHLLGVLHRRNNNIGNSVLYVSSPEGAISPLHDLDECKSPELNDCHPTAMCSNTWGTFRCQCDAGYRDPWGDQPQRAGRECQSCSDNYCNNHGTCSYNDEGNQVCTCDSSHYGGQCEIDGEVLGVAIGASVAAIIIIVLTLICLIMWSRRWQREQKNAMGSPVFGYMNTAPLKAAGLPQAGYQVTLEDRMRWAQIADVMAQTNHYGSEPMGPTRPSSAMFAYPNLSQMGMGTIGGMSMQSTLQMHQSGLAPPVPLPRYERLGLTSRSNGMRTLENSSSSEEEDRTDLLGRNFQVPRPKSRSNGSIANQSGIYYDVDYEPSGNGIGNTSVDHLYGSQNQSTTHSHMGSSSHIPGPQGIPMSTYTSGRAPSSYYMK